MGFGGAASAGYDEAVRVAMVSEDCGDYHRQQGD